MTNRKGPSRSTLTLADLSFEEVLAFRVFWSPEQPAFERRCCRWETYEEFDGHYAALREQPAEDWFCAPDFAEARFQALQRGEDPPSSYPYAEGAKAESAAV